MHLVFYYQPIRRGGGALRTPEFVLSEAIYFMTKKNFEEPDKFRCMVPASDKNSFFTRTPALLTLIFCRFIQH